MADLREPIAKVLDTTELLECILIHLDNRTLLLSQRRKLFLRPESTSAGSISSPKTPNKRFNPLFLDEFGRSLPRIKAVDRSGKKHTFFVNRKRKLILESTTSRPVKAADMKKGSWRKMLLTQPPAPVRYERHHVTKSGIVVEKKRSNRNAELKYQSCSVAELIGSACPEEMEDV
ncbi:hypothetical protein LTR10_007712 [Elasticomyces elasticus]|nr:hypothetical protein LTR10_007712 [Elasticomyces elasticus]KAK4970712.1 hypothetical protein LTR42_007688 [Elasticomyces elasticus]